MADLPRDLLPCELRDHDIAATLSNAINGQAGLPPGRFAELVDELVARGHALPHLTNLADARQWAAGACSGLDPRGQAPNAYLADVELKPLLAGAPPPAAARGYDTPWPLGLRANLSERKVLRDGIEADLGGRSSVWEVLSALARNHPAHTPLAALWDGETEQAAVYMAVTRLRAALRPLGLTVESKRGRPGGYVLAEQDRAT
jgi:hypothetical protein